MSAYAPNPSYENEDNYAPLTASLLARKGEATPAVDADAHAGVDIDMAPMGQPGAQRKREFAGQAPAQPEPYYGSALKEDALDTLDPANYDGPESRSPAPQDADFEDVPSSDNVRAFPSRPSSEGWTVIGPSIGAAANRVKARLRKRPRPKPAPKAPEPGAAGRKATVTFRMPARDLVRLRFASRELAVSCQTIILEALESYLEANDVASVSDEDFAAEADRLMRRKKGAKRG